MREREMRGEGRVKGRGLRRNRKERRGKRRERRGQRKIICAGYQT